MFLRAQQIQVFESSMYCDFGSIITISDKRHTYAVLGKDELFTCSFICFHITK